jgi:hypothetical protein
VQRSGSTAQQSAAAGALATGGSPRCFVLGTIAAHAGSPRRRLDTIRWRLLARHTGDVPARPYSARQKGVKLLSVGMILGIALNRALLLGATCVRVRVSPRPWMQRGYPFGSKAVSLIHAYHTTAKDRRASTALPACFSQNGGAIHARPQRRIPPSRMHEHLLEEAGWRLVLPPAHDQISTNERMQSSARPP